MYALIIIIGMSGVSGGVTSQIVGKFKSLDECKAAASQPHAGGPISDFSLSATWGPSGFVHTPPRIDATGEGLDRSSQSIEACRPLDSRRSPAFFHLLHDGRAGLSNLVKPCGTIGTAFGASALPGLLPDLPPLALGAAAVFS
jgi:hypothetical protein